MPVYEIQYYTLSDACATVKITAENQLAAEAELWRNEQMYLCAQVMSVTRCAEVIGMPYEMILAYVPEYGDEFSGLDLKAAAKIARQRDLEAAENLLLDFIG